MKVRRHILSEATVQAELYGALKREGFHPILEQKFRHVKIRVDVCMIRGDDYAYACIEVKSQLRPRITSDYKHTLQHLKYGLLGLPFMYCTHMSDIPKAVEWVRSLQVQ